MLDLRLGDINICNPLENQMPELIETFVSLHGEERRELITNRLSNAKFLFLPRFASGDIAGIATKSASLFSRYTKSSKQLPLISEQFMFMQSFFQDIIAKNNELIKKEEDEIKSVIVERLPELFSMTKEEFFYMYAPNQIDALALIYREILKSDRAKFLDDFTANDYHKNNIIRFFRAIGDDRGNKLENYVNDVAFMDWVYDEDLKDEIMYIKEKYEQLRLGSNPFFQDALNEIQSLDIHGGNLYLVQNVYNFMFKFYNTSGVVLPYMRKDGSCASLCLLPLDIDMSRKVMLHECEHIIEMCWANTEDEIVSKSGFDCVPYVEDEECYDGTNLDFGFSGSPYETRPLRKFEIISEVWNDLLAHILYYHSKNCGLEIGTVGLNESWYVKCMRLISPLDSYLDVILNARMNSDFNAFENLFGKNCSNELNEVINRYYKLVTDGGIKFMGFEKHIERITGQTIAEIDFLNLPPKEQWSEFEKQVIALHQEMAVLTKRINKRFAESEWNESVQDGNESE